MGNNNLNKPSPEASHLEIYGWIAKLGESNKTSQKAEVARFLTHPAPSIRRVAISTLVLHWALVEFESACIALIDDPDPEVQAMAVSGVASLHTRDLSQSRAAPIVLQILRDRSRHWIVRSSAYYYIQMAMDVPKRRTLDARDAVTFERSIDWELIDKFELQIPNTNAKW